MDDATTAGSIFRLQLLWVAVGVGFEFLVIPNELRPRQGLFTSGDFYYALLSPVVIWWFFRRLIPAKERELTELGLKGVRLLNLILGFYAASVVRAILAVCFSIHLGVERKDSLIATNRESDLDVECGAMPVSGDLVTVG